MSENTLDSLDSYKCNTCGAPLVYKPGTNVLLCEHCGTSKEIVTDGAIEEHDFESYMADYEKEHYEETKVVICSNCKATPTIDENLASMKCPYCNSPLIEKDIHFERYITPEYLYPFQIAKKEVPSILKRWVDGLWFAPNSIKKAILSPMNLNGIYMPYWTYDAKTRTEYRGERGIDYTVTVGSGKDRRTETRTRWTDVSGAVRSYYDDVLVSGTRSLNPTLLGKVENWDTSKLLKYNASFLSGFITEKYQIDLKDGFLTAQEIIKHYEYYAVKDDIGGDRQRVNWTKTSFFEVKFKHILLPIYISAFQYKNKSYSFYINGVTGSISGERPYSNWKIFFAIFTALVASVLIYYFFFRE